MCDLQSYLTTVLLDVRNRKTYRLREIAKLPRRTGFLQIIYPVYHTRILNLQLYQVCPSLERHVNLVINKLESKLT